MKNWKIAKLNKDLVRFQHERAVFTLDFRHSQNFNLDVPADAAFCRDVMKAIEDTENGVHVNVSEDRMAGHFWLRRPQLAPEESIRTGIAQAIVDCKAFSKRIHSGEIANEAGEGFQYLAAIGIGGSQLGFQFIIRALGDEGFKLKPFTLDNTDPDTVDSMIREIGQRNLDKVLFVVASKSGGTTEIRNIYTIFEEIYKAKGLRFGRHAVAVTMEGSKLYDYAKTHEWLDTFPVWDWVGGRFSVLSPVGLLPLALLGLDIDSLLEGAGAMDVLTRNPSQEENPALLLTRYLITQTGNEGKHHMVVLPYKDKLDLWGKYLQQLFMESLGKTRETGEGPVHSGLSIFGNKGTTDQHSYVQQLLAGYNDFFALFFSVLREKGQVREMDVEEGSITMGDFLLAFCHGTMSAMAARGRESMLITMDRLDAFSLGALIALFERIVGCYAVYAGLNPYDQPQVEEGKKSAGNIIQIRRKLNALLAEYRFKPFDTEELKKHFDPADYAILYYQLLHLREKGWINADLEELDKLLR
ncbi:MAG: glucose-6-phosphate isomerase [Clostridiales bacterium]|nr:glucose-6-phosphate isomerase [Clostridiales bacterium]